MIFSRPFRKPFWILNTFFKKHKKIILITTLIGAFLFLLFRNLIPLIPKPKPNHKIGLVGQYNLQSLPVSVSQNISRGLTKIDQTGQIEPDMAKSWEILENNTLYKFYLSTDIFWSNGTVLKSSDLKYDIPNVQVSYPDETTIEFKLQEPFSPFLSVLTQPKFKNNSLSAGQFFIKKTKYQGPFLKSIELIGPNQNLLYRFYSSNQSAWLGFKLGEVDQLQNLVTNPLDDKWEAKLDLVTKINYQQYLSLILNNQNQYLSNKTLRQALAYAVKHKSISNDDRALVSISPLSWAYNPDVKPYTYNSSQANELYDKFLEQASVSGQLKINLGTSQSFLSLAEQIAQSWQETLNIDVQVQIINTIDDNFEVLLIAQEIPLDPDQHALWHSTQNTNISNYSNLKVDKLLEDGRKELDLETRIQIYHDFQRFLLEDSPVIFLRYPTTYTISRK